ncbi:MAG: IclR family transcriptional regulator C-terminal domain-containing protein [Komagataeibacter saccharivorans]|uniref:IclR family transcriptional regulator n=1 Tax=Komagataeibacter saccharivorans TaxID=265959 RepID=UPI0039EBB551
MRTDVKSALRTISLLELLSRPGAELTHTQIVECLDVPKSSLTPLLQTLVDQGYVSRDGITHTYSLGEAVDQLMTPSRRLVFLRERLAPVIIQLATDTDETALFGIRQGLEVCVVNMVQGNTRTPYQIHEGEHLPLKASSAGKTIWANETRTVRVALFQAIEATDENSPGRAAFDRDMKDVAQRGIAIMRDKLAVGVTSVSTPLFTSDGRLLGALSVGLLSARYTETMHGKIVSALRRAVVAAQERLA